MYDLAASRHDPASKVKNRRDTPVAEASMHIAKRLTESQAEASRTGDDSKVVMVSSDAARVTESSF